MEYIKINDKKYDNLDNFKIPRTWWSRGYEYAFADEFIDKDVNVLDAGCGLVHPFKLYLKDKVKSIVAIDIDEAIKGAVDDVIEYRHQNIKDLTDKDKFDVIFCLGVLHHDKENLEANLKGLKNALATDGIIAITFDNTLDVEVFKKVVDKVGLEYHKEDKEKPKDALVGSPAKISIIKTILKVKEDKKHIKKTKVESKPKNKIEKTKTIRRKVEK